MEEKKRTPALALLLIVVAVVLLFVGGYLFERSSAAGDPPPSSEAKTVEEMLAPGNSAETAPVYMDGRWYRKKPEVEAYLLMGIDRTGEAEAIDGYIGGGQADLLLLLVVDHQTASYRVLQINRDTMAEVEILGVRGDVVGTEIEQIALAHGYGDGMESSCENTVRAVSRLLYGSEIDGYAALQMDAVPLLNDAIGGVTVTVEDDFSAVDRTLVQGETLRLQGEQALHFVRARHYVDDDSNLSRMRRQRTYLSAFAAQFERALAEESELLLTLYEDVQPYMVTDISGKAMSRLAQRCRGYTNGGILTLEGEARMGEEFIEYLPDEDSLKATVLQLFYTEAENESSGG